MPGSNILQMLMQSGGGGQGGPPDLSQIGARMGAPQPGGVAAGGRSFPMDAIRRRLGDAMGVQQPPPDMGDDMGSGEMAGIPDPRGMEGILSRGANVYNSTAPEAQMGGGDQFGPPVGNTNGMGPEMGPEMGGGVEGMMAPRNALLRRIMAQRGNNGILS